MPVYQYACTECGDKLEVRQSFTDDALTVCPSCAGRLRKVLTAVGVVFKGSGFYRNDSRSSPDGEGGADKPDRPDRSENPAAGSESSSPKEPVAAGSAASTSGSGAEASSRRDAGGAKAAASAPASSTGKADTKTAS